MSALADAVDRLSVAFVDVPRPTTIATCPCCFTEEQATELLAQGRSPSPELVLDYAAHAMGTVGGVDDLRYFTPRILQLLLTGDRVGWPELELVAGRLRLAAWTEWSPAEREAIRDVLGALWAQTLGRHPSEPDADTALCAIGNAEDDLTPYLADWTAALAAGSAPGAQHLWDFVTWGIRSKGGRWRLTNAFWERDREGPVVEWLSSDSTRAAVRRGSDTTGNAVEVYTFLATFLGA